MRDREARGRRGEGLSSDPLRGVRRAPAAGGRAGALALRRTVGGDPDRAGGRLHTSLSLTAIPLLPSERRPRGAHRRGGHGARPRRRPGRAGGPPVAPRASRRGAAVAAAVNVSRNRRAAAGAIAWALLSAGASRGADLPF